MPATESEATALASRVQPLPVDRRDRVDRPRHWPLRGAGPRVAVSHVARVRLAGSGVLRPFTDELWIYRHIFSAAKPWAVGVFGAQSSNETGIEFYRKWAASLTPDAELGYVRAPGIRTPCHETTNLATRGIGEARWDGPKIVFVGDSFVESAACSNDTLTTKVQKLTGIDTLNFGVALASIRYSCTGSGWCRNAIEATACS